MKLLQVISTVDPKSGGPVESLRSVGKVLQEKGHTVEVASVDSVDDPWVKTFPLPVHALGPGTKPFRYSARLQEWLSANAGAYDALISRGLWEYHGIATRQAAITSHRPYWVFAHGMLDPWFNRAYPLKATKKYLYWPWQYRVLRDAESVLFTSEEERLLARRAFRPYRVIERVVDYGSAGAPPDAEDQRSAFCRRFPDLASEPFILYLGRIHPKKGCDILLEGVAQSCPKARRLALAGPVDEGYKAELAGLAGKLGLTDRITWAGMLQGEEKWGAFRSAECFILPSHQENFGIAVVEALSCGLPVLISRSVNIWREIIDAGAGFAAMDTVSGVRELLDKWNEASETQRSTMGRSARQCFEARYTVERAADSLIEALSVAKQ